MSTPFLSEIKIISFNFPPKGWAFCNGQLLPINQNQALFALLGTTYGGDGRVNFALPNLQGRSAMHASSGHPLGQRSGETAHTLTTNEMPAHGHTLNAVTDIANASVPGNALPAARGRGGPLLYAGGGSTPVTMSPKSISAQGGGQPHENMQPYLTLNFVIALQGIFPSQN